MTTIFLLVVKNWKLLNIIDMTDAMMIWPMYQNNNPNQNKFQSKNQMYYIYAYSIFSDSIQSIDQKIKKKRQMKKTKTFSCVNCFQPFLPLFACSVNIFLRIDEGWWWWLKRLFFSFFFNKWLQSSIH